MKKIGFGILIGFLLIFTGCFDDNEDGYSLNNVWVGIGTIQKTDSESATVKMDNNDVLVPIAYNYSWQIENFKNGERVLINYTILDEDLNSSIPRYFIKINSIKDVLTKGVLDVTPENQDSIGNDPIIVKDCWMTDSMLNFQLKYWGSYKVHFINLVKQPGDVTADNQPFELELRHNNNNDDEAFPYTAFVSFKLKSLQVAGLDSVSFHVSSTDYDGEEFTYDGVYKYGENN